MTSIVREGAHVAIDFYAYLMACFSAGDPPTVWSYDQRLGSFAAGDYTISARYHYIESPDASPFATLGASMRVVRGNDQAFALPTISAASALVLGVVIAMIGTTRIRRRRLPT